MKNPKTAEWEKTSPRSPDRTFGKQTEYFGYEDGEFTEDSDFLMTVTLFTDFVTDELIASVCFRRTMGVNLPVRCFSKSLGAQRAYLDESDRLPRIEEIREDALQLREEVFPELISEL